MDFEERNFDAAYQGFMSALSFRLLNWSMHEEANYALGVINYERLDRPCPDYVNACARFEDVTYGNFTPPLAIKAHFFIATMYYLGQTNFPINYQKARTGFTHVLGAPSSLISSSLKEKARTWLAKMDYKGEGIDAPNYAAAYEGFTEAINSPATPENVKAEARTWLEAIEEQGLITKTSVNTDR